MQAQAEWSWQYLSMALGWLPRGAGWVLPKEPPSTCMTSPERQRVANLYPWDKPTNFTWCPCCSVNTWRSSAYFLRLYLGVSA